MQPCSLAIFSSICFILTALTRDKPPNLIARAICSTGTEAIASQLPKLDISELNALPELASEVFWERMVPTSTATGSSPDCHSREPYSCSKSLIISSIVAIFALLANCSRIYDSVAHKVYMKKSKVILDMDPGIDDALALILALCSPEIQVLGLTTVAGNAAVDITSANARRVLEYLDAYHIPVAMGAAKPLKHPLVHGADYHGPDGLGQLSLPSPSLPLYPAKAWDFLARSVSDAPGEITVVATGPLTNVAHAFRRHPVLSTRIRRLIVMGGAYGLTPFGKGNRTPFAEFNIWQDPEAARLAFSSGVDIFAIGLDVSMDPATCLSHQHLERIETGDTPAAHLTARLAEYGIQRQGCCRMHDPLALSALLDPSLFDFMSAPVEVVTGNGWDRGITRVLPAEEAGEAPSIHVAAAVDGPRFLELFLARVREE